MKLSLIDFIGLGVSALGAVLLGVCNMKHASEAAVNQVDTAFKEAEKKDESDN